MANQQNSEELNAFERFVLNNQKVIAYTAAGIVLVIAGYLGYQKFILEPQEKEASRQMYMAQIYYEKDSLDLALYGDSVNYGFLDIADNYSLTPSGNLANYYAGSILLRKGEYEQAIDRLKSFDGESFIVPAMAEGMIGDAYAQKENYEQAGDYYFKAAEYSENEKTGTYYLVKAGYAYEAAGQLDNAKEAFEQLAETYPESDNASLAEKKIAEYQTQQEK